MITINSEFLSSTSDVNLEYFNSIKDSPELVLLLFEIVSNMKDEYEISDDLIKKSKSLKSAYKSIPKEIVWDYWSSWSFSVVPANGILFLKEVDWLDLYPELFGTIGALQNPATHPEGDVFNHLCLSVNEAASISRREDLDYENNLLLIFGSLCHDIGKQVSLDGHEKSGVDLTNRFLLGIGMVDSIIPKVCKLVRYHMVDYMLDEKEIKPSSINYYFVKKLKKLLSPVSLEILIFVHEADKSGRLNVSYTNRLSENFKAIRSIYNNNLFKFDYKAFSLLVEKQIIPYPMAFKGFHRKLFVDRVNAAIKNGYLKKDELTTVLGYTFHKDYRDSVFYVDSLGYRDKNILLDYINSNDVSLDELLMLGKSEIEEILNHSEL
jgi:hypothetical protein